VYKRQPFIASENAIKKLIERNKVIWKNPENLNNLSIAMKKAVHNNPTSYSSSNINGRVKKYEIIDVYGEIATVTGSWELVVAKWLSDNNIEWTNKVNSFEYEWEGKIRRYFPDFYLPNFDIYLEVKGYERERDRCKWKAITNLKVLRKTEIEAIKEGSFSIKYIAG
jgi:hypothetical protein